jgi:hypothetical protein
MVIDVEMLTERNKEYEKISCSFIIDWRYASGEKN